MSECERISECSFINHTMVDKPGMVRLYKKNYCMGDRSQCAIYLMAEVMGPEKIPEDMCPNMIHKAEEIIANG